MSEKFAKKYRSESNRLKEWDYSSNGHYFITINTFEHQCLFGHIENDKMSFSEFGKIALDEWFKSFKIRKELFLDEFIIMPNHLHAIVVIDKKKLLEDERIVVDEINDMDDIECKFARPCESTMSSPVIYQSNKLHRKPKSISSFVAGYKSSVVTEIDNWLDDYVNMHGHVYQHKNGKIQLKFNRHNPLWQSNYHDHVIRNIQVYYKIKNYIKSNPANWNNDKFYRGGSL